MFYLHSNNPKKEHIYLGDYFQKTLHYNMGYMVSNNMNMGRGSFGQGGQYQLLKQHGAEQHASLNMELISKTAQKKSFFIS